MKGKSGFTLLELSISLIIIALIIGGILLGKSLKTNAQLQTVITDADSYITAAGNFKQTYQALPGDFATATSLWGTDSIGCPTGGGATGTCNGNGDGEIATVTGQEYEAFRFWQHLYMAGMFSQNLSGVDTGGVNYAVTIGVNVPAGSIKGSGFSAVWYGTISCFGLCFSEQYTGYYGNVLLFGGAPTSGFGQMTDGAILTPTQAAAIDTKIDDGMPATGKVKSYPYNSLVGSGCTTVSWTYNISATGPLCSLIFLMGY